MKKTKLEWLLLGGALLFLGVALVLRPPWSSSKSEPVEPLLLVPSGPALVVDIDLARLARSPLAGELERLGKSKLADSAAAPLVDPLREVVRIVLAAPSAARLMSARAAAFEPDAMALIAAGSFNPVRVAENAAERIRARGGEPVSTTIGKFLAVRNLKSQGELAVTPELVVVSDGAYQRAVLAAAEGQRAAGSELERALDAVHAELRRTFGREAPIIATLALSEGWLEQAFPEARSSPLAALRAAALRVDVKERVRAQALLVAASPEGGAELESFLERARRDLLTVAAEDMRRRLQAIAVERRGERIELSLDVEVADIASLIDAAMR